MKEQKIKKSLIIIIIAIGVLGIIVVSGLRFYSRSKSKPNIIFITLDALRSDHLGCYGYRRNTSPNIDSLAARGVLFTQAISQSSWTSASNSSIITSLYPNHEGKPKKYCLSPRDPNLIKILKNKGYITALFSGAEPVLSNTLENIRDAFDVFDIRDAKSDTVVEQAINWLTKHCKKSFFLWVYLFEPHGPYTPPSSYYTEFLSDNLYSKKSVPIANDDGIKNEFYSFGVIPRYVAENDITDINYYIAKYDGEIKFADEQIGKLLNQVNKLKLENNTLIVLFSDHGESMGEHDFYFNHSHYLYEGLIRVPLIVVFLKKIPKNKLIRQQVQLIDVMPTVLDLGGIKSNITIEGESLLPLIIGKTEHHNRYAFSESPFRPSPQCVRTDDWKLIYNRCRNNYELYNIKDDPHELNNLITKRPEIAGSLKQHLDEWLQNARTHRLQKKRGFSEEERKRLRSLGYAQ